MKQLKTGASTGTEEMFGKPTSVTHLWVEDQNGNKISNEEMLELFNNLTAVGYWVKRRYDLTKVQEETYKKYSYGGLVTNITEKDVMLNGKELIPRNLFHKIFQLD
jgi:hypothetical protein